MGAPEFKRPSSVKMFHGLWGTIRLAIKAGMPHFVRGLLGGSRPPICHRDVIKLG
jgi:hypothetical protein